MEFIDCWTLAFYCIVICLFFFFSPVKYTWENFEIKGSHKIILFLDSKEFFKGLITLMLY